MKQRLRPACCRLLAAAMLAGLMCTPAAAVPDLTLSQGIQPIVYEFLDAEGQSAQYPKEEDAFHVGVNYVKSGTHDRLSPFVHTIRLRNLDSFSLPLEYVFPFQLRNSTKNSKHKFARRRICINGFFFAYKNYTLLI